MEFLQALKEQILVLDGAMGTMIQDLDLSDQDFGGSEYKMLSDLLTFSRPDDLKNIHLKYLQAGSNAIETNTFGASTLRLSEYDFSNLDTSTFAPIPGGLDLTKLSHDEMAYHMSKAGGEVARRAIAEYKESSAYDGRPLFAVGSIGPSNWVLSSTHANLNRGTYSQIVDNFYRQVLGLIDGGCDVLLYETQQDPLELKAAIHGGQKAMAERGVKLPIMAQVTVDQFSKMQIFNTDITAVLAMIQGIGIDVMGINCSIGPDQMVNTVKALSEFSKVPISIIPNAGLPVSEGGRTVFKQSPSDLAGHLLSFVKDYGVNIVGGCCGTRPDHIKAIAEAVKGVKPVAREIKKQNLLSGPQNAVPLDSSEGLIRIGERLNVRGSLKVREAVEGPDGLQLEPLEEVVNEQVQDLGLNIIDVCMDSNLVNTEETLVAVVKNITTDLSGALCLDSFSVEALLDAVKVYPGRPLINSISLEEYKDGVDKIDAVVPDTRQHDPVYIALCTDATGPAQTAQEKADFAKRIYDKCHSKYGIRADQLMIDMNAFPIGSESIEGMNFAMESINSIPLIKAIHPDIMTSIGVGNLTNGLAKKPYMRKVLTSVFIDLARKKGLDAAIINPNHYVPVESLDPKDVEIAHKIIIERDMDAFSQLEEIAMAKKGGPIVKKCSYEELPLEESICQKIKDGFKSRKLGTVTKGDFTYQYQDTIVEQVALALEAHKPLDFINHYLMKAMQELGDGFGRGEVSLPHLLKSADVMKQAMGFIEGFLKHDSGADLSEELQYKGTVVIGTVYQDVHSIGKDLVKTLLENYGYRVIDLGVQTPLEKFIATAKEHKADAIGASALLVQTSNHMITLAKMLVDEGLSDQIDFLIGGAPVNRRHAASVSMHGQEDQGRQLSNVFYCSSGMDAVNVMNQLMESKDRRQHLRSQELEKLKFHYKQMTEKAEEDATLLKTLERRKVDNSQIKRSLEQVQDPMVIKLTMKEFLKHMDTKTLFSLNWRYGGHKSWEKKGVSEEILQGKLREWVELCDKNQWLIPQAVCGLFPCKAKGDDILIYDTKDTTKELARVNFNVVIGGGKKDTFSVAQYFLNGTTPDYDLVGLQISTGGSQVDTQIQKFKDEGDSESALLLQGLSDRVAEDMAEYAHKYLSEKMKSSKNMRYSPGYPALKDIQVNKILHQLLKAKENVDVELTDAAEFNPTGSTGAVVCFHPQATYE